MKNELIEAFVEGLKMPFQILAEMYAFIKKLPSKVLHRAAPAKPSEAPDPN